ncbi:MAG: NlpC/P60 family protein [Caulobacteraceae bacterium]
MTEQDQRALVVAEARTWLATPYAHRQRLRGAGVDCAQLPLAVYEAAGVLPPTDVGAYPAQWHMHRSEERYLGWLEKLARPIDEADVQAGDFMVFRFGRTYSHGAIIVEPGIVIHALARARLVTVDDYRQHEELRNRDRLAYTLWGR